MTFAGWRSATPMRIARDLLAGQTRPSSVARRIAHTHLPNVSAACTPFHGTSPREFQDRGTEDA